MEAVEECGEMTAAFSLAERSNGFFQDGKCNVPGWPWEANKQQPNISVSQCFVGSPLHETQRITAPSITYGMDDSQTRTCNSPQPSWSHHASLSLGCGSEMKAKAKGD